MRFETLLSVFSFKGRATRKDYALTYLAMFASLMAVLVLSTVLGALFGKIVWAAAFFAGAAAFYISIFAVLAVSVRRLHDRDRSGWWIVPYWLAPTLCSAAGAKLDGAAGTVLGLLTLMIVGAVLVDLGLLEGTKGPNSYGVDPTSPPPLDDFIQTQNAPVSLTLPPTAGANKKVFAGVAMAGCVAVAALTAAYAATFSGARTTWVVSKSHDPASVGRHYSAVLSGNTVGLKFQCIGRTGRVLALSSQKKLKPKETYAVRFRIDDGIPLTYLGQARTESEIEFIFPEQVKLASALRGGARSLDMRIEGAATMVLHSSSTMALTKASDGITDMFRYCDWP